MKGFVKLLGALLMALVGGRVLRRFTLVPEGALFVMSGEPIFAVG